MESYWTNFAKTGDPNGAGLPAWPPFASSTGNEVMHLSSDSKAKPEQNRARDDSEFFRFQEFIDRFVA